MVKFICPVTKQTQSYKLCRFFDLKNKKSNTADKRRGRTRNKSGSQIREYKTDKKLHQYRPGGHKRESEILFLHRLITRYKQWQCIKGLASNIWLTWKSGFWDNRGDINKWGISVLCVCTSQWSLCIPVTHTQYPLQPSFLSDNYDTSHNHWWKGILSAINGRHYDKNRAKWLQITPSSCCYIKVLNTCAARECWLGITRTVKKERQCTYNVTMRRVRVTIAAVQK
jgi:hypothetical protein